MASCCIIPLSSRTRVRKLASVPMDGDFVQLTLPGKGHHAAALADTGRLPTSGVWSQAAYSIVSCLQVHRRATAHSAHALLPEARERGARSIEERLRLDTHLQQVQVLAMTRSVNVCRHACAHLGLHDTSLQQAFLLRRWASTRVSALLPVPICISTHPVGCASGRLAIGCTRSCRTPWTAQPASMLCWQTALAGQPYT